MATQAQNREPPYWARFDRIYHLCTYLQTKLNSPLATQEHLKLVVKVHTHMKATIDDIGEDMSTFSSQLAAHIAQLNTSVDTYLFELSTYLDAEAAAAAANAASDKDTIAGPGPSPEALTTARDTLSIALKDIIAEFPPAGAPEAEWTTLHDNLIAMRDWTRRRAIEREISRLRVKQRQDKNTPLSRYAFSLSPVLPLAPMSRSLSLYAVHKKKKKKPELG